MTKTLVTALFMFIFPFSVYAVDESISAAADSKHTDWKLISDDNGVRTFQRNSDVKYFVAFRGEITVNHPIEKVAALLADMESRKKWMHGIVETHRLHMKNMLDRVEYNHTSVSWPFQDRDFVYQVNVELEPKERIMIINMKSTTDDAAPEKEGIVRGEMRQSRYWVKEIEAGKKTFISVEIEIDPKGAIPLWLVRLKQRAWPEDTLSGLDKYIKKNDVKIPDEFKSYIDQLVGRKEAVK
jgi:uncharacterized protein YndB with AHSA1/START domain